MNRSHVRALVIGGGQAGLAVGYHLRRHGLPFLIVDENERVGDAWRKRWDSLRLFTPARYNNLPGMPFPGPAWSYPTKDQTADYLEAYARNFDLPVRTGVKAERLSLAEGRFDVSCGDEVLSAANVVVATGAFHQPRIPPFATSLDATIYQTHSSAYHNRSQLREGPVLIAGAGNSGAEIAMELAAHHRVWLSGPDTGQEPTRAGSIPDRFFTPIMCPVGKKTSRPRSRSAAGHSPRPYKAKGHHCGRHTARGKDHRGARRLPGARRRTRFGGGERDLVYRVQA
jgi:putative flavoprotein involved in K+ transport